MLIHELKSFRNRMMLTQADMALLLNINPRSYAKWEQNKVMLNTDNLAKLKELTRLPYAAVNARLTMCLNGHAVTLGECDN